MSITIGITLTIAIVGGFLVYLFLVRKNDKIKHMDASQPSTINNQPLSPNPLDEKIKSKFKLFQGLRPQEEDQKIYDKVMDLTFDEMMAYLGENLSEEERNKFLEETAAEESDEGKNKLMQSYFSKVENVKVGLGLRIDHFLNNLLYSSLKAANQI